MRVPARLNSLTYPPHQVPRRIPPLTAVLFRYFHDAKGEMEVGIEGLLIAELSRERTRETGLFAEIVGASPGLPAALARCVRLCSRACASSSIFLLAASLVAAAVHPSPDAPPPFRPPNLKFTRLTQN